MLAYLREFLIARHRLAVEAVASSTATCRLQAQQRRLKLNRFNCLFWWSFVGLDQVVRSTRSRQARNGGLSASGRIPPVLDMAIPRAASGVAVEARDLIRRIKRNNPT